jgi:DNA-binding CsgD family transcriptional regulator
MDWPLVGRDAELRLLASLPSGSRRAAVLVGPAGVGKTRLAREWLAVAESAGLATLWIRATRSVATLPFGALASILPPAVAEEHSAVRGWSELLRRLGDALSERAAGRQLGLVVDDAHLLDDGSAALIGQLVTMGDAVTVLTVRTGVQIPGAVVELWKDELAERVELSCLTASDVELLLGAVLDGPLDPALTAELVDRCGGNTLYLRELVHGALADGTLLRRDGLWQLTGPVSPSSRLVELIKARLAGLTPEHRRLLEALAYGEPLGPAGLEPWGGTVLAEQLETAGLVSSWMNGRRLEFGLAHPLYGDALRTEGSAARARSITLKLAETVETAGLRRGQDTLRVATWRLVAGEPNADLMIDAARMARWRYDFDLAERLVHAALDAGGGFAAELLAAELASLRGRGADAEQRYANLSAAAARDHQRAQVATARLNNLAFSLGDWEGGLRLAAETEATVRDPVLRREVAARSAGLGLAVQGPRAAAQAAEPLLVDAEGTALVWACLVATFSLGRLGRIEDAMRAADRGQQAQLRLNEAMDWYPWFHVFSRCEALAAAGRFVEAEKLAKWQYQEGLQEHSDEARAFFAWHLARNRCERGHAGAAVRYGTEAAALFRKLGRRGHLQSALEDLALAYSLQGDTAEAESALNVFDTRSPRWLGTDATIARAWIAVSAGDLPAARKLLSNAAALGEQIGDLVGATSALHGLARLGQAVEVVETLGELAGQMEGDLPAARAEHARRLLEADPYGLLSVAGRFEAMGADLLAAEACADAAVAFRRAGNMRTATAAGLRSDRMRARCGPVRTPALQSTEARARLTPAERETVMMAAVGRSDREIADALHLSLRTIENRLYHSYRKLGIGGRDELAEALACLDGV